MAIDGNMNTMCATTFSTRPWLSVRVPSGTAVGWVAVHNRRDAYANLIGSFEVWLGRSAGDVDPATAVQCGGGAYDAANEPAPYVVWCGVGHGSNRRG